MAPHDPAPRATKRIESFRKRLEEARTPRDKLRIAYDHFRAAAAISGCEEVAQEVSIVVTQLSESANRLLSWRTE